MRRDIMSYDPDMLVVLMKYMKFKYSNAFIKSGTMMFGSAMKWSKITDGAGRGDKLEGIYAICKSNDFLTRHVYQKRCDDSYTEQYNKMVYFRSKRIMELPCYCLYGLSAEEFTEDEIEKRNRHFNVLPQFFHEFADIPTDNYTKMINDENRPSLVLIYDIDEFYARVINSLHSLDVDDSEIIISGVNYSEKSHSKICHESPLELLWKSPKYMHQNEVRIIINTNKADVINRLATEPINIGPLTDIARHFDVHFDNGLTLKLSFNEAYSKYTIGLLSH